jgi:hypothetical protein
MALFGPAFNLRSGLTPYRKLEVGVGGLGTMFDLTSALGDTTVRLEEEIHRIDRLSFTLQYGGAEYADAILEGDPVTFTGGYVDAAAGGGTPSRVMFKGHVSHALPRFTRNGRVELDVIAEDARYRLTRNKPGKLSYPCPAAPAGLPFPRPWRSGKGAVPLKSGGAAGSGPTLAISQIVRGIVEEYGIKVGEILIDEGFDWAFGIADRDKLTQNPDETDYEFILRRLTGQGRFNGLRRDEEARLINAYAVNFMEVDPIDGEAKFYVMPESKIITQVNGPTFIWQGLGHPMVPSSEYDPTGPSARIIAEEVQVRVNTDLQRYREEQHRKDVARKAKGRKGHKADSGPLNRGEAVQHGDDDTEIQEAIDAGTIGKSFVPDDEKIKAAVASGQVPAGFGIELAKRAIAGSITADEVRQWMKPRATTFEAPSRKLSGKDGEANVPEKPDTSPAPEPKLGAGKPKNTPKRKKAPKVKPLGDLIQKFGQTMSFTVPGNIFVQCRRMSKVELPSQRFGGENWFCRRIVHEFGRMWNMSLELAR